MYDGGKIILGLAVFVGVVTTPVWYSLALGKAGDMPALDKPSGEKCVESREHMRAWHMDMLNQWRDAVVRGNERVYVSTDGSKHSMSLTSTCLKCHADPAGFCDRCHEYSGVKPFCWDCHLNKLVGK